MEHDLFAEMTGAFDEITPRGAAERSIKKAWQMHQIMLLMSAPRSPAVTALRSDEV